MEPGTVVADRFVIEALVGSGGMGTVYRALDRQLGGRAAVKVLHQLGETFVERFVEEARVLEALQHPGIVRYIAHGEITKGAAPHPLHYLATEWLDGCDLAQRLGRQPLSLHECLTLALKVADALGAAHSRGIIHRDVKPTNLFLPNGEIGRVKLLDFGVSRQLDSSRPPTGTGVLVGTPGYMAPEQARGGRSLDPRLDVFSLGCVLFECLTGSRPFSGDDILAVLAKVLLEEAPQLRHFRADVPAPLEKLLERMLSKDPGLRPLDGQAVAAELSSVAWPKPGDNKPEKIIPLGITSEERRLAFVIVTGGSADELLSSQMERDRLVLESTIAPYGGCLERLVDGTSLVLLARPGSATDQAGNAARCALAMRKIRPDVAIALGAGRVVPGERASVGDAIDRAVHLLRAAEVDPLRTTKAVGDSVSGPTVVGPRPLPRVTESSSVRLSPETSVRGIRLDDALAALLDAHFEIAGDTLGLELLGENELAEGTRTLLGKPTPYVGREAEMTMLMGLFQDCVTTPQARAVLVTGEAGIGKSRLRYEIDQALREQTPHLQRWLARGDPMYARSPFSLVGQLVARVVGIREGEASSVKQRKLCARVARNFDDHDLNRIAAFLSEMIGAPMPDENHPELAAARRDALLMGDQIQRAWENWLAAELAETPLLLLLEDLHWGDGPSVRLIDGALRHMHDRPLFVLGLARPEIQGAFPQLWAERALTSIRLGPLPKKASEKLVQGILGDTVSPQVQARLVNQSGGNAYYLEELVRAAAERRTGESELPETVLAMTQARLEALEWDARQLLRAASLYGNTFWLGGVRALLAGRATSASLREWCDELVGRELLTSREPSRFPGEREYAFRHAFLRDAASAMLTAADRELGHRLAGEWLERAGEKDARVLAWHYEQGQELWRAARFYARAAEQALEGNDFAGVIDCANRAVTCGVEPEAEGPLRLLEAEACRWRGDFVAAKEAGQKALAVLLPGSGSWYRAAGEVVLSSGQSGDLDTIAELAQAIEVPADDPSAAAAQSAAWARCTAQLLTSGKLALAEQLLLRIANYQGEGHPIDGPTLARICSARAVHALGKGDLGQYITLREQAVRNFEQAGDLRSACSERANLAYGTMQVGAWEQAHRILREAMSVAERLSLKNTIALLQHNLGLVLARLGAIAEGRVLETAAQAAFAAQGNVRMQGGASIYLALIEIDDKNWHAAEKQARIAVSLLAPFRPLYAYAQATLARVLLACDNTKQALELAREAFVVLSTSEYVEDGEALVRVTYAEAAHAMGEQEAAREAVFEAASRLQKRALAITNADWQASFLERIPEHARIRQLCSDWRDAHNRT